MPHVWFFSQLYFTAYKNTFFILSLERQSSQILLDVFIETKPKGNILNCLTQLKRYLRMSSLMEGQITKLLTAFNLITGEPPTHMNEAFSCYVLLQKEKRRNRWRRWEKLQEMFDASFITNLQIPTYGSVENSSKSESGLMTGVCGAIERMGLGSKSVSLTITWDC